MSSSKRPSETIKLQFPVVIDGANVTTLVMRRPTVRDQLSFEEGKGSEARKVVNMLANLCEVTPDTIMDLDQSDFTRLGEVLSGFQQSQQES